MQLHQRDKGSQSRIEGFYQHKKAAITHFEQLYREEARADVNITWLDVVPPMISSKMNQSLEEKITLKEVKEALLSMDPDKAPGPDGFTPGSSRFVGRS